jgi:hypothetical protein
MAQKHISIREYQPSDRAVWEAFVDESANGTLFHKQDFLDYHHAGRFQFRHLLFFEDSTLIALLPAGIKKEGTVLASPVGASYGSFVVKDMSFEKALALVDAFLLYARQQGIHEIFLIPPPIIYHATMSQHIEYALLYRRFGFELHYISHAVDVRNVTDIFTKLDKTARKTVRKILRNSSIAIQESQDYEAFYEILLKNKQKHNATPTHSLEELYRLRELMPQNLILLMVYKDDVPIAGSLLFICNNRVLLCFYTMLLYEYQEEKPVYLLNYEILRLAQERGFEWVDIGVSQVPQDPDPMTPALSLIEFKERFGARGVIRSTYYLRVNDPANTLPPPVLM